MEKELLIKEAKRIAALSDRMSLRSQSREFIRRFAGDSSDFYKILNNQINDWNEFERRAKDVMTSFIQFTESGLMTNLT